MPYSESFIPIAAFAILSTVKSISIEPSDIAVICLTAMSTKCFAVAASSKLGTS
jgi:hypothetical protein